MSRVPDVDRAERELWAEELAQSPVREQPPTTVSGRPIEPLYTPNDQNGHDDEMDLSDIPASTRSFAVCTRACRYRGRLWTMRQFAGFGTPRQTNERFKFLLEKGQTGLSTAFDLPTLMGLDSDHPRARPVSALPAVSAWRWTRSTICWCCSTASTWKRSPFR